MPRLLALASARELTLRQLPRTLGQSARASSPAPASSRLKLALGPAGLCLGGLSPLRGCRQPRPSSPEAYPLASR
eukprot:1559304-Rhodomonas_salina.1